MGKKALVENVSSKSAKKHTLKKSGKSTAGKLSRAAAKSDGDHETVASKKVSKRKAVDVEENDAGVEKRLNKRKKKKKELTTLYSELINPGRDRKPEVVVQDLLDVLQGRSSQLQEFVGSFMGSRVVQACLKWGSRQQRQELFKSLKEHLPKLAVNRFGYVVVLKLLNYAMKTATGRKPTEAEKKAQTQNCREFMELFRGKNLRTAFYHKQGCKVINGIYFSDVVSSKEKRKLLHDIAIPPSVALLQSSTPGSQTLRQMMATQNDLTDDQRKQIISHLREAAEKAIDKELLGCDVTHFLFQALCENLTETQLKTFAEKCMDGAPYLLSSKPGAEALIRLLGVANAKQRKSFCKELKGKFAALASNAVDYVVMIRLACTVDDTVLVAKTMFAELTPELETLCFDKYGHKVLAWLFKPADKRFFSPYEIEYASLPAPTSLKAPDTRRQELVRVLRPPLRQMLMKAPLKVAADESAKNLLIAYLSSDWDSELIEALLQAGESERENKDLGLLGNNGTSTTTLIALLRAEPSKADPPLAGPLWDRCLQPRLAEAVTSRCSFVLLELLKGPSREALLGVLRKRHKELEAAVKAAEEAGTVVKGGRNLLEEVKKK